MAQKAPVKHQRQGINMLELMQMFPNETTARQLVEKIAWPKGSVCPYCQSTNVQTNIGNKTMTHRRRSCSNKPRFSLKSCTVIQSSKLYYQTWAIAIYMVTTNIKGVSSMKLNRDLTITQNSA